MISFEPLPITNCSALNPHAAARFLRIATGFGVAGASAAESAPTGVARPRVEEVADRRDRRSARGDGTFLLPARHPHPFHSGRLRGTHAGFRVFENQTFLRRHAHA